MAEPALMPPIRPMLNAGRPQSTTYPVWSPQGEMFMRTREQINDLVRHGTLVPTGNTHADGKPELVKLPWTLSDPTLANAKVLQRAQVLAAAAATRAAQPGVAASHINPLAPPRDGEEPLQVLPRLDALRKQLSDLGVAPDPTWGVVRMESIVAAKKAGLPVPADPEDSTD